MPGESPNLFGDGLRRLASSATYLYADGPRYWYSTQPTVTKLADDRAEQFKRDPAKVVQELDKRLRGDLKKTGEFSRVHPFDLRWAYFTGHTKGWMAYPRTPLMWSALKPNRLLLTIRNPRRGNTDSFFVANTAVDKDSVSPFDNVTFFPLYTYRDKDAPQATLALQDRRDLNLRSSFVRSLCIQTTQPGVGSCLPKGIAPEDVFHYIYAVVYSPAYRARYAEFLKIDFPRIPLPGNIDLFRDLARLGGELVALHLMESPRLDEFITSHAGLSAPRVVRVGWSDDTVWLDAGKTNAREGHRATRPGTIGFHGVSEEVWNFHIGGYQVCHKWLKDRKGRALTKDDIDRYQKIVVALSETIRIMTEIDEVIDAHGGWPGAFVTEPGSAKEKCPLSSSGLAFQGRGHPRAIGNRSEKCRESG